MKEQREKMPGVAPLIEGEIKRKIEDQLIDYLTKSLLPQLVFVKLSMFA